MPNNLSNFVTPEQSAAVKAPIETARTLPRAAFMDEGFYQLEVAHIYQKRWVALGFTMELAEPRSVRPVDLCGMPLLLARDADGAVRCFHNVCPYDSCLVVLEAATGVEAMVVPYHGFRYQLDGTLIAAPHWLGKHDAGPDSMPVSPHLHQIACVEWHGMIFVNLSAEPEPFEAFIAPLLRRLDGFGLDRVKTIVGPDNTPQLIDGQLACNWKTNFENACINVLHESFVHQLYANSPQVPRIDDEGNKKFQEILDGDLLGFCFEEAYFRPTYGDVSSLPHVGLEGGERPATSGFMTLFPNFYIGFSSIFLEFGLCLPLGPERCHARRMLLTDPTLAEDPMFADLRTILDAGFRAAGEEDGQVIEAVQRARRSPAIEQQFYSPFWDAPHHRLNQLVLAAIEDADPAVA